MIIRPFSFTDVPKIQTLALLKSQKPEVNETLFAAAVPMKKQVDTSVFPAHVENGGDKSGTRCFLCTVWSRSRVCCALGRRPCLRYTAPRRDGRRAGASVPDCHTARHQEPHDDGALHAGWLCNHAHRTPGLPLCGDGLRAALYQ